jgi:membrane protease YdiL (CAAX protease family)
METGNRRSRMGAEVGIIDAKVLVLALAVVVGIEAAMGMLASRVGTFLLPLLGSARLLQIVLILLVVTFRGKGTSSIGCAKEKVASGLKRGMIWSSLFGLLAGLVFILFYAVHVDPARLIKADLPSTGLQIVLFFVVGGLIAPVAEEIFFRGIVYGFLRRWGLAVALIGSTLLFAGVHPGTVVPITQIIGGLVFAAAYEIEGNLIVPITIHVLGNTAIFGLSLAL